MRLGILRKASRAAIKERRWPASRFPECKQPDGNTKAAKGLEWSTSIRLPGVSRGDRQGARVAPPPVFPWVAQRAAGPRGAVR